MAHVQIDTLSSGTSDTLQLPNAVEQYGLGELHEAINGYSSTIVVTLYDDQDKPVWPVPFSLFEEMASA